MNREKQVPRSDARRAFEVDALQLVAILALVLFVTFAGGVIYERGRADCAAQAVRS